jgi:hypothetical protein
MGNHDDGAKTQRIAHHGETDAGVPGGAFDDDAARLQLPAAHGIANDEKGCTILDGLARIHELGLAENFATGEIAGTIETDQRCVADRVNYVFFYVHLPIALEGQTNLIAVIPRIKSPEALLAQCPLELQPETRSTSAGSRRAQPLRCEVSFRISHSFVARSTID